MRHGQSRAVQGAEVAPSQPSSPATEPASTTPKAASVRPARACTAALAPQTRSEHPRLHPDAASSADACEIGVPEAPLPGHLLACLKPADCCRLLRTPTLPRLHALPNGPLSSYGSLSMHLGAGRRPGAALEPLTTTGLAPPTVPSQQASPLRACPASPGRGSGS